MKDNELRIGNFVTLNNIRYRPEESGQLFSIVGIAPDNIRIKNDVDDFGQLPEFIQPIPLTEDWLVKFGFEKTEAMEENMDGNCAYQIRSWGRVGLKNGELVSDEYYFLSGLNQTIQYVHQLQNLYFALTGEELMPEQV